MSTQTITKKRKSAGDDMAATKKAKVAKSGDKPATQKSALKKPKQQTAAETVIKPAVVAKPKAPSKKKEKKAESVKDDAAELAVEDAAEGGAELTEDQTAALLAGFSSSEDEASDSEDEGMAVEKLPQAPRMKDIEKRIKASTQDDPERTPGVVYVGRIPHGFYERQMRAYFSQFGDIQHLRLARNRKTGKSQHYAFVEFASKAVAEIVAKTMDKYLLFGHILQVRTVPREQVRENMWNRAGQRKKPAPRNRLEGNRLTRGMVREDWERRIERETKKRAAKADKLKEIGYEFEAPVLKPTNGVPRDEAKQIEAADLAADAQEDTVKQVQAATDVPAKQEEERKEEIEPESAKRAEEPTSKKRPSADAKTAKKKAKKLKK